MAIITGDFSNGCRLFYCRTLCSGSWWIKLWLAAISELPFNLIQGGVSAVLGYVLSTLLEKAGVQRLLE